jgi:hypothetical protein
MNNPEKPNIESEINPDKEDKLRFVRDYIRLPDGPSGGVYESAKRIEGEYYAETAARGVLSYSFTSLYFKLKDIVENENPEEKLNRFSEDISHTGRHRSNMGPNLLSELEEVDDFFMSLFLDSQKGQEINISYIQEKYAQASVLRDKFDIKGSGYLTSIEKMGVSQESFWREKLKRLTMSLTGYLGEQNNGWDGFMVRNSKGLSDEYKIFVEKIVNQSYDENYDINQLKADFEKLITEFKRLRDENEGDFGAIRILDQIDEFYRIINDM